MKRVLIYIEGGGDSTDQKAALRRGFDDLFQAQKDAARARRLGWSIVLCGSRGATFKRFAAAVRDADPETLCVLLVDSEEGLAAEVSGEDQRNADTRVKHLIERDHWQLMGIDAESVHLMVQCMEAWLVADPEALAAYYGQGFHASCLPARNNLEEEPKLELFKKLSAATKTSTCGEYSSSNHAKIKHAARLLELIDPRKVAARCPRFATFTTFLDRKINPPKPS